MRETNFIKQNKTKWAEFEKELEKANKDADKTSSLFIQLTDDLSYARTFYKNRSVRYYLNILTQQIYQRINFRKKFKFTAFKEFWTDELPALMFETRKELLFTFTIFILSMFIGIISSNYNHDFSALILGQDYLDITNENISKNDPMAIYKDVHHVNMFLGITLNNLRVALVAFVTGIVFSFGSILITMYNGIMVGVFQNYFIKRGLFKVSFLTIWMHGSLEIPAIIISASAGIVLGKSLILPGTYTRIQSLQLGGKRAFKVFLGIGPIIVLAAIIESFVTRYTDLSNYVRAAFILASFGFVYSYFIWYPYKKHKSGFKVNDDENKIPYFTPRIIATEEIKTNSQILFDAYYVYKNRFGKILKFILYTCLSYNLIYFILGHSNLSTGYFNFATILKETVDYSNNSWLYILNTILFCVLIFFCNNLMVNSLVMKKNKYTVNYLISILVSSLIFNLIFFTNEWLFGILLFTIAPVLLIIPAISYINSLSFGNALTETFSIYFSNILKFTGKYLMIYLLFTMFYFLFNSPVSELMMEFIEWNVSRDSSYYALILNSFYLVYGTFITLCTFPILFFTDFLYVLSENEVRTAKSLKKQIANFNISKK